MVNLLTAALIFRSVPAGGGLPPTCTVTCRREALCIDLAPRGAQSVEVCRGYAGHRQACTDCSVDASSRHPSLQNPQSCCTPDFMEDPAISPARHETWPSSFPPVSWRAPLKKVCHLFISTLMDSPRVCNGQFVVYPAICVGPRTLFLLGKVI